MSKKGKETDKSTSSVSHVTPEKACVWRVSYLPEADKDFQALAPSQRFLVRKAIAKVSHNPLSSQEGGYGKTLGGDLFGLLKIKLKSAGLRVVYKLIRTDDDMLIVVIGARADDDVYDIAKARAKKHKL